MNGRRAGIKASHVVIDGADRNEFMIRPDAFAAQNTFAQISDNKRICLLQRFVVGNLIQIGLA